MIALGILYLFGYGLLRWTKTQTSWNFIRPTNFDLSYIGPAYQGALCFCHQGVDHALYLVYWPIIHLDCLMTGSHVEHYDIDSGIMVGVE